MADPTPLLLDLADFDAVGIAGDVVGSVRSHAIEHSVDASATVSAPEGWHRVIVNCSSTGKTLLRVRFTDLTKSRANNVAKALAERGWQTDEDGDGAASRHPSGVEATTIAFDALAALTTGGAPGDVRQVTAFDADGRPIPL
jgi:hypothetical protein